MAVIEGIRLGAVIRNEVQKKVITWSSRVHFLFIRTAVWKICFFVFLFYSDLFVVYCSGRYDV